MSTSLQSFFDEMKKEEVSNESLDIDVGELLSYCIESKSKELNEIGKFIERIDLSLESLKSKEEVTNEDIASFESQVTELLEFSGAVGLQGLLIPSMESVSLSDYTTEAEEKAESVKKPLTEKMKDGIKFVLDKLAQLVKRLKKQTIDRLTGRHKNMEKYLTDLEQEAAAKLTAGKEVTLKIPGIFVYDNRLNVKAGIGASDRGHSLDKDLKKYLEALKNYKRVNTDILEDIVRGPSAAWTAGVRVDSKLSKSAGGMDFLNDDKVDPILITYRKGALTGILNDVKESINRIHESLKEAETLVEKLIEKELKALGLEEVSSLDEYNREKKTIMLLKSTLEGIYKEFERYSKRVHDGVYKIKLQ